MTIVIIGGSGFIGTRLTRRLVAAGHIVKILDKQDSKTYPELRVFADVRDRESLKKELSSNIDCVINLAAEHRDDVEPKSLYDAVNVDGAENVCQVCAEIGIKRIIFTSSVAVYGFAPLNTNETGKINYFNDYGRTKWLAEGKYREWLNTDKSNSLTIIRPTVVFGEQNRGNVYNLLRQISSGFFPFIGSMPEK
ncbi:NAD-dependent epimerase/dehydratase family protein [Treponema parvum]|uniref:NAD-dependent epimerase/dehydratase family protein n=1 Tax=Treponema parvum TaxID=138851 RepID=UPI00211DC3D7|nr:NAD-dependent epimerase/dehydratase family protein [Treponema parvum]